MGTRHAFFVVALLIESACGRRVDQNDPKAADPSAFVVRYHTLNDLAVALRADGHKVEAGGPKFFQMVGAVDGGRLTIDGHELECYVFDQEIKFDGLEKTMKGMPVEGNTVTRYANAKCF